MDAREQQLQWRQRAAEAEAKAAPALVRLLELGQMRDSGQAGRVARFVAGIYLRPRVPV